MGEEEILKVLNRYTTDLYHSYKGDVVLKATVGLLDLYNKEKEKNKILDNMLLVNKEQYEFIKNKDDYISKDKIKVMIDKINKDYDDSVDEEGNHTCYYPNYTIDKLQELLEERN